MPDLLPALSQRRARRAFEQRPVPPDIQETLWRAVSVAPSHGNAQPTRLLFAESEECRLGVVAALSQGNRGWAAAAPLLVGIAAAPAHDNVLENSDSSTRELWAFHAGIATGNLLAQATELGLLAHPMAGFDEVALRRLFAAPEDVRVLAVVAIGYPGDPGTLPEDLQRRETADQERVPLATLVARDRWTDENQLSARELRKRTQPS